jgi:hypothetical protein
VLHLCGLYRHVPQCATVFWNATRCSSRLSDPAGSQHDRPNGGCLIQRPELFTHSNSATVGSNPTRGMDVQVMKLFIMQFPPTFSVFLPWSKYTHILLSTTGVPRCNIPEDAIPHSHIRENLKFYISVPCGFTWIEVFGSC